MGAPCHLPASGLSLSAFPALPCVIALTCALTLAFLPVRLREVSRKLSRRLCLTIVLTACGGLLYEPSQPLSERAIFGGFTRFGAREKALPAFPKWKRARIDRAPLHCFLLFCLRPRTQRRAQRSPLPNRPAVRALKIVVIRIIFFTCLGATFSRPLSVAAPLRCARCGGKVTRF